MAHVNHKVLSLFSESVGGLFKSCIKSLLLALCVSLYHAAGAAIALGVIWAVQMSFSTALSIRVCMYL